MAVGAIAIFETGDETGTRPWLALLFRSHAPVEDHAKQELGGKIRSWSRLEGCLRRAT
jgi:hypothetical protein